LSVFTIGHSTRSLEEFTELLQIYKISLLLDVRTVPHSRHNPQFNKEVLPIYLKSIFIKYVHLPEIGGLRRPNRNSINLAIKNASFRGYADYMQTKEFTEALLKVITLAHETIVALMCAEALPWKCHRSFISDALTARHIEVLHIISKTDALLHRLNEAAYIDGSKVSYPLYPKESSQRTLSDFSSK
jgi:uncharacterized protein (DUF488 family)